ncbi:MAG TPA: DUF6064 family protein [Thermohalobaculum sp.]|nr:DUF6064 family protein [Thermohalobaculum sp.]
MSEWWSYRPGDFLLFAPRTYWRLFELENAASWPLPLLALALGAGLLVLLRRPRRWSGRVVALALALAWAWVGWRFVGERYAAINWAAVYAAPLFYIQALLLAWFGAVRDGLNLSIPPRGSVRLGLALYAYALILHPLTALAAGRPLAGAEIAGIAPDPTAIATLGVLVMLPGGGVAGAVAGGVAGPLLAIPLAWCLMSGATLATMGAWQAWIPLAAAAVALAAWLRETFRPRSARAHPDA